MDRLVHNAYRIELDGESIRKMRGRNPSGYSKVSHMSNGVSRRLKARDGMADDLREASRLRRSEWMQANGKNRAEARERFLEALRLFSGFVLYGRLPKA
jgi:hypothetical protein